MEWQQTSIDAYGEERNFGRIGKRQEMVKDALLGYGPMSNRQISQLLNLPINSITPRVKELRNKKLVEQIGTARDAETGKTVIIWGIIKGR